MSETTINTYRDAARDVVVLTIMTADGKGRSHECDAKALERLMHDLAALREQMKDEIPRSGPPDIQGVQNPPWSVKIAALKKIATWTALVYRHPGFGWQLVAFSPDNARLLGKDLIATADKIDQENQC